MATGTAKLAQIGELMAKNTALPGSAALAVARSLPPAKASATKHPRLSRGESAEF